MRNLNAVLPVLLLLAACSQAARTANPEPAPPPTVNPVGVFDMTLDMEGNQFGATLSIQGSPGTYTGTVDSEMGSAPVSNVVIEGMELRFVVSIPEADVYFRLVFDGDAFNGEWGTGEFGGALYGKRR